MKGPAAVLRATAVMAIVLMAGNAAALQFSADVVNTARGSGSFNGKAYAADDKFRMEMAGMITITRMDKGVMWVIVPDQNLVMEQPIDMSKVIGATEKMPGEVERTLLGPETVGGRAANKYRIVYTDKGARATVIQWIDTASGIPLKTSSEDGSWTVEYRNLVVGSPDPSLFEIPAQYSRMQMPNMADMMRAAQAQQSDTQE